jgi:hypothetical protein
MRPAGRHFARDPFQVATQVFELDPLALSTALGACLLRQARRAKPRALRIRPGD